MKIKVVKKSYQEIQKLPIKQHTKPIKPNMFFRVLMKLLSIIDLKKVNFKCNKIDMEKLGKKEPALFLMNHSSFIDMEIAQSVLFPRPINIVCTNDGFVGKNWLMRQIGCINTPKFVSDPTLVRRVARAVKKNSSILMYPEASYSFDGKFTPFPFTVAKFVKFLKIPVVTIITNGAYLRQPLYNELRKNKLNVSCEMKYLISKDDLLNLSEEEIFNKIVSEFQFDSFKYQQDNNIKIDSKDRAVGLNRVLYKCPHCLQEGKMTSYNHFIKCEHCQTEYELTEYGYLHSTNDETKFNHIPDWFNWQRQMVKEEIEQGNYNLDIDVDILYMRDTYTIYNIGSGHLTHNIDGFHLTNETKEIDYVQESIKSYTINADFYWYQIDDIICVGDYKQLFYCFPKNKKDIVAKTKLATEEIYKIIKK